MRLTILSLIIATSVPIHAQQWSSEVFREDIIVTATALPEDSERVPASATVITREEIERRNAIDLEEVLRDVPGLFLSRAGSAGRQTSLFTRGVNSAQTLVLWNGIEINNPYFSGYDWGQFSTAGVEKVEVVRGPFSSLYGADAVGGVVNVITGANRPGWTADLQAGEDGLFNGRLEGTGSWDRLRLDGTFETREDDGFHPNDDFRQVAVLTSLSWELTDRVVVGFSGSFNDYELGIPFNLGVASPERRQDGSELQIALPLTAEVGRTAWSVTLSRTEHEINFDDPLGTFGPIASETDSEINRLSTSVRLETPLGTIVAGGELEDSTVDDVTLFGPNLEGAERSSASLFAEDRFSMSLGQGQMEISAGFRYDDFEEFGSQTSPRLSLAWVRGSIRGRFAYGEAFRAPSIGDLFFPFYGNPELDAERSRSWEFGGDWTGRRGSMNLTWFHNDIDDLIVFDPTTNRAENIGSAITKGVELGATLRAGEIRVHGSWTFLDTEDRATGLELLRRPENSGSISIFWDRNAFSAMLNARYSGERDDFEAAFPFGRVTNASYTVADIDLKYDVRAGLAPYIRLENVFDEDYQEVIGFPAPPRRAIIGLRYSR